MDQLSTVTKALQVLQAFSYEHPVMGVSELGRKLAMGKSSVHRVLSTLAEQGFVVKTEDDRYRLGLKLHELGQLVVSSLELRQVAHAPLERLHNECGETVHVGVLEGTDVMYVHRMEAQSTLRTFSRVGRRVPAHHLVGEVPAGLRRARGHGAGRARGCSASAHARSPPNAA